MIALREKCQNFGNFWGGRPSEDQDSTKTQRYGRELPL
jgi:hypothetical protein